MKNRFLLLKGALIAGMALFLVVSGVFAQPPGFCAENPSSAGCSSDANAIVNFLNNIIDKLLIPLGGAVAFVFLLIAAFLFMSAQGETQKIETAKRMIFWTLLGLGIIISAKFLVGLVEYFKNK